MRKHTKTLLLLLTGLGLAVFAPLWAADAAVDTLPAVVPVTPAPITIPAPVTAYFPVLPLGAGEGAEPQLLPMLGNHALLEDHTGITRAIIVIHDYTRDANAAFSLLTTLAGPQNATTMILTPQFLLDTDIAHYAGQLPQGGKMFARWPLGGWESGGDSAASPPQKGISSFTALDLILLYLGEKKFFPDLQQIIVTGHGTGGDFVQRYAAMGQAPELLDRQHLPVRFVAANAASYLYFTASRMVVNKENGKQSFGSPDATACPTYNLYPYGLESLNEYGRRAGVNAVKLGYVSRAVIYLVGEQAALGDRMPDGSCAALLEGPDRVSRAMNYNLYLNMIFGEAAHKLQKFITIPKAGYDPAALFGSRCGLSALFSDGECM